MRLLAAVVFMPVLDRVHEMKALLDGLRIHVSEQGPDLDVAGIYLLGTESKDEPSEEDRDSQGNKSFLVQLFKPFLGVLVFISRWWAL